MEGRGGSIGVIDSGIGGITTLRCMIELLPRENYIYLADKSAAPYGDKSAEFILERTKRNCLELLRLGVKAIVIACNTATNVGIAELRSAGLMRKEIIYVGLEPAIKPAFEATKRGKILVLLTPATARQEKFQRLVARFDPSRLIISPQPTLASLVEENISLLAPLKNNVYNVDVNVNNIGDNNIKGSAYATNFNNIKESAYATSDNNLMASVYNILDKYDDVGAVVLGCTHYVYLRELISEYYKSADINEYISAGFSGDAKRGNVTNKVSKKIVEIYDGNRGAALRLASLLKENNLLNAEGYGNIRFIVT